MVKKYYISVVEVGEMYGNEETIQRKIAITLLQAMKILKVLIKKYDGYEIRFLHIDSNSDDVPW